MLHLDEETKVFDFLTSVKFHASSFSVCIKFNFIERILKVSLWWSFHRKFSYQSAHYVKLTNIKDKI